MYRMSISYYQCRKYSRVTKSASNHSSLSLSTAAPGAMLWRRIDASCDVTILLLSHLRAAQMGALRRTSRG